MNKHVFYFDGDEVLNLNHVVYIGAMETYDYDNYFRLWLSGREALIVYEPTNDNKYQGHLIAKRSQVLEAFKNEPI